MKPTYEDLQSQLTALTSQLESVVAENAALKAAAEFATAPDMWVEQADGMLEYRYVDWYVDTLKTAMETPATDAILAEVRASGVEMMIEECESDIVFIEPEDEEHYILMIEHAKAFAAQLRQEAAQ